MLHKFIETAARGERFAKPAVVFEILAPPVTEKKYLKKIIDK